MADIRKLRELGKQRYVEESRYYNEIIKKIEDKMLETAPFMDSIQVIFTQSYCVYGCSTLGNKVDNRIFVQANKFNDFSIYRTKIASKYRDEGFLVTIDGNGHYMKISWEIF